MAMFLCGDDGMTAPLCGWMTRCAHDEGIVSFVMAGRSPRHFVIR